MEQLLQAKLDGDRMKSVLSKLDITSITILLVWSDKYLVGKWDDSKEVNGNCITSGGEVVKSYRFVWKPCRLIRLGEWMMDPFN